VSLSVGDSSDGHLTSERFAVDGLTAGYGSQPVLFEVSASFSGGTITSIIGPNGAGKSTVLKAIFGVARVFQGQIRFDGDPVPISPRELVRRGVAYVPQRNNVFPSLSVRENLEIGAYARGGGSIERVVDTFPALGPLMTKAARKLSGGQRNMLAVGRALMCDPKVLFLDEASGGLAPIIAADLWKHLVQLAGTGIAVVVVEQNVSLALRFSSKVYLLAGGRNQFVGTPADLRENPDLERLFLEGVGGVPSASEGHPEATAVDDSG